jgi:hypothetical protein
MSGKNQIEEKAKRPLETEAAFYSTKNGLLCSGNGVEPFLLESMNPVAFNSPFHSQKT